jgi:hypothetical protein
LFLGVVEHFLRVLMMIGFLLAKKQELVSSTNRPKSQIIRVIEGFETVMFRSKFDSWPQATNVTMSEDGRGKVAGEF